MRSLADLSLSELPLLVTANQEVIPFHQNNAIAPFVLLPGSFNPLHAGHTELAAAAEKILNRPVAFELSIVNVDKAELTLDEVKQRCAQFGSRGPVWITRAPRFTDKAALFPGATFVVGADTALRLVQRRYYQDNESRALEALATLRRCRCRFLVAARADVSGRLLTLADVPIPAEHRDQFAAIPPEIFCCDLSSTGLRLSKPANG